MKTGKGPRIFPPVEALILGLYMSFFKDGFRGLFFLISENSRKIGNLIAAKSSRNLKFHRLSGPKESLKFLRNS